MRTITGMPIVKPSPFEYAIVRIEQFKKGSFDKETLQECVMYVAKTSKLPYKDLVDKLRLNFTG